MFRTILLEFSAAWKMFISLPLPLFFMQENSSWRHPVDGPGTLIRPLMPAVGFFLGLLAAVPLWFLAQMPNGRITAGLAGAVAVPLFMEIALSWEGLNALAGFFDLRRNGATLEEALSASPQSMNTPRGASSGIVLMTIYLLRMIFFGVLAIFAPFWIVVSLVGSFLVRAELAKLNKPGQFGTSFLKTAQGWEKRHWMTGMICLLPVGVFYPFGTLLALAVAWLLAWIGSNMCLENISGITKQAFGVFSYAAELVLLFLGILLYAAPR